MNDRFLCGALPPPPPPPGGPTDTQLEEVFHQNASLVFTKAYIDLDDFLVAARVILDRWRSPSCTSRQGCDAAS